MPCHSLLQQQQAQGPMGPFQAVYQAHQLPLLLLLH
jgi:hypothetical protein